MPNLSIQTNNFAIEQRNLITSCKVSRKMLQLLQLISLRKISGYTCGAKPEKLR